VSKPAPGPTAKAAIRHARAAIAEVEWRIAERQAAGPPANTDPLTPNEEALLDLYLEEAGRKHDLEAAQQQRRSRGGDATAGKLRRLPSGVNEAVLLDAMRRVLDREPGLKGRGLAGAVMIELRAVVAPSDLPAYDAALTRHRVERIRQNLVH
jgi:hypothetical protein